MDIIDSLSGRDEGVHENGPEKKPKKNENFLLFGILFLIFAIFLGGMILSGFGK